MLTVDTESLNNILYNSGNICINKINLKLDYYKCLRDIAVLVTSNKGYISSKNIYFKHIIRDINNGSINYSPIFISAKPLNVLECFDLDVSNLKIPQKYNTTDFKDFINRLYKQFIMYVSLLLKSDACKTDDTYVSAAMPAESAECDEYQLQLSSSDIYDELIAYVDNLDNISSSDNMLCFYKYMLVFTRIFQDYINALGIANSDELTPKINGLTDLMKAMYPYFCSYTAVSSQKELNPLDCFKDYIKSIFIDKTLPPGYDYFEGEDNGQGHGYCYYLHGKSYFDDFAQKYNICISQTDFNKLLRSNGIIKLRQGNRSVVMEKVHNDTKQAYILILRDKVLE